MAERVCGFCGKKSERTTLVRVPTTRSICEECVKKGKWK